MLNDPLVYLISAVTTEARRTVVLTQVPGAVLMPWRDEAIGGINGCGFMRFIAIVMFTIISMSVIIVIIIPQVPAILAMFLGGQETGAAWASVLFGDEAPSGRLPLMMPATEADTIAPSAATLADIAPRVVYSEGAQGERSGGACVGGGMLQIIIQVTVIMIMISTIIQVWGPSRPEPRGMATSYRSPSFRAAYPFGHGLDNMV